MRPVVHAATQRLMESLPTAMAVVELDGRFLFANEAMRRLLTGASSQGQSLAENSSPRELRSLQELAAASLEKTDLSALLSRLDRVGREEIIEFRLAGDNASSPRRIHAQICRASIDAAQDVLLFCAHETTDASKLESASTPEGVLEPLLREAPIAFALFDRQMRCLSASARWIADHKLQGQPIVGRSLVELLPEISEAWRQVHQRALQGHAARRDRELLTYNDGQSEWISWNVSPWHESSGEIGGVMIYSETLTEQIRLEERLQRTQQLSLLGGLVAGVAHEFNNILAIVVGNLDTLAEKLPDEESIQRRYRAASQSAERGAELTHALLSVAASAPMQIERTDLNDVIGKMLPLLRVSAGHAVDVRSWLADAPLVVSIDERAFRLALLNMIQHARDAMRGTNGRREVLLRSRLEKMDAQSDADARNQLPAGWYAVIEMTDTGPGMDEQALAQVFEPVLTTSADNAGVRLGLTSVRAFAQGMGGDAQVRSTPGSGTCVQIYLPALTAEIDLFLAQESSRLQALRSLSVLDTDSEPEFDALVAAAAGVCGVPIAFVSLVDQDRQWFKARHGMDICETPRDVAFCSHAIRSPNETMVVADALQDSRFSGNPLVSGEPFIRFYAGVPLTDSVGHALGTLCVLDNKPHHLSEGQLAELRRLARKAANLINSRTLLRAAEESAQAGNGQSASVSVLVVDDEEGLCELACNWFESIGFNVVGVHDPDSALALLRKQKFNLLFTDVVMPGSMDGVQLAREAKVVQPEIKVLITSGYAATLVEKGTANLPGRLIPKPYRKPALLSAVQQLDLLPT